MNNPFSQANLEYESLKSLAIKDAEKLAATTWTDHTNSDPGVTILEQCIAQFLRLGQNLNLPLADLLNSQNNIQTPLPELAFPAPQPVPNQFFTANEVLTTAPISINDRRRVLLDHPLVANVQVEQVGSNDNPLYWNAATQNVTFDELVGEEEVVSAGRYRALVELVPNHQLDSGERFELVAALLKQLKTQRNLSEQWQEVILLEPEYVKLKGGISLKPNADVEQTLIDIHQAISQYINPPLTAQTRADLQSQGVSNNEIYQGPRLENGFFPESTLNNLEIREEVRASDLIRIILDFEQVEVVHSLLLSNFANPKDDDWRQWVLPISSGRVPRLEPILQINAGEVEAKGFIDCFKDNVLCGVNAEVLQSKLTQKQAREQALTQAIEWRDVQVPTGNAVDLSYQSMQLDFPVVYGLGENVLPDSVGPARLAQVKQLQGYLMLFDQVIANYHQQLANMGGLLSSKSRPEKSYQHGEFTATDMDELTTEDYWQQIKSLVESELTTHASEQHEERENRLLDHLFARLGERFEDHTSLGFSFGTAAFAEYLQRKQSCLFDLAALGQNRFLGAQYLPSETQSKRRLSGVQQRLSALLGLTEAEQEQVILVERSLLYPQTQIELPTLQRHGALRAQLRKDGRFYTIMEVPDHGLVDGDVISLFGTQFSGVADEDGNVEVITGANVSATFANTLAEQYTAAYRVTVLDKHTIELDLDLKLDPENEQIRYVFDAKWTRGIHYKNPYAMQVDMIINQEIGRFSDAGFRQVFLKRLRQELPAHIAPYVHWLSDEQMQGFTPLYQQWLVAYQTVLVKEQAGETRHDDIEPYETLDLSANQLLSRLV